MRNFENARRVVIKIGTNTLSRGEGIDAEYMAQIAEQVAWLTEQDKQVLLVSSGAIGMGAGRIGHVGPVIDTQMRQACAAIGQPLLMHEYHRAFAERGLTVAQVLLTADVLSERKTFLNLRNAVERLLELGVVPIVNENDSVSTEEIDSAFGDNDTLSALVASKVDADLLIILSDVDALYDGDPRERADAKAIDVVWEITPAIVKAAGGAGTMHSTGGMRTKIKAARVAANAGCKIVLAHGRCEDVVRRIVSGETVGTLFMSKRKLNARTRWILNSKAAGTIHVDRGAMDALRRSKSLLPSGVVSVSGTFAAGAVVMVNEEAKAVTSLSSDELTAVAGKHSSEIREVIGADRRDVVAVPEDVVFLDY
ncbi:Glutamate 5-kinase 1 [Anaerohalosphaera lusitana]|uniref:Glutamate 5-kinase n=1 Tax=Anaerohalosphaera lusitana TaxID=1936003 RepID=A0A1U9NL81_9BACT|nr:glutamate 5-kinase [Anaerohalosphaera lusitana]AQT68266.1 Glutamate 5-kinase 1 [Anaerohalosphaera lusitana]